MNIKNSNEKLHLKIMIPVAFLLTALLCVARAVQLVRFIDPKTGFLFSGETFYTLFLAVIAVSCIFFAVVSFLSSESKCIELVGLKSKGLGIVSCIFAVSLVYDALDSFKQSVLILNDMAFVEVRRFSDLFKALMSSGSLPYALQSILALFSMIYILILAKSFFKGSGSAHKRKILALFPIAWVGFKIITRFVKKISYIKVSDLFLELIMLAFAISFFVALAQVVSGVYSDVSRWRITALGLSAGMLSLCINIPRLVLTFVSNGYVNAEYPFNFADAMFGLFAFFVAFAAIESVKEKTEG